MPEGPSEHSARAESGEIATSTLAEIYAQQGLLGRALTIYRRMLSRAPDDAEIAGRIESLERRIETAGEEEERARAETVEMRDPQGAVEDADPAETAAPWDPAPEAPVSRERLPWDPPEAEEEAEPVPEAEPSPAADPAPEAEPAVRPMGRDAFEAWLARW